MTARSLSMQSVVSANPELASEVIDGQAVILQLETSVYYGLNEVGSWVWETIQTPQSVGAIHSRLLERFDVDSETAERDLLGLLERLAAERLIEIG